jgi:hypothetical protein
VSFVVVEIDKVAKSADLRKVLLEKSKSGTVPQLFLSGTYFGGCEDVKARLHESDAAFIASYMTSPPADDKQRVNRSLGPLFWFPHTVDNNVGRVLAAIVVIYCALVIAFWQSLATTWAVFALALDYSIRFLWGGSPSFIGVISQVLLYSVQYCV